MKTIKKSLAILMSVCLLVGCIAMTAVVQAATTGSITIQNPSHSTATVAGKTFNVYKVFNATTDASNSNTSYSWYVDSNGDVPFHDFFYGVDRPLGEYTGTGFGPVQAAVSKLAEYESSSLELSQLAEDMHKYILDNGIDPVCPSVTAGDTATSVTISNLDFGYYLVYDDTTLSSGEETSAVRSAVMLTTVDKDWTITLKANRPQVLKQVRENNGSFGKGTSVSVGDTVTFKISTAVPSRNHYSTYYYAVEDTMHDGLSLQQGSIKVYYDGTLLTRDADYTLDFPTTGTVDFKVDFTASMKRKVGNEDYFAVNKTLSIEYDAEVTDDIEAQKANQNTAKLIYSNDPVDDDSRGTVSDSANVYSYQFVFTKFAQDSNGTFRNTRLAGAEFKLYREGEDEPILFTTISKTVTVDGQDHTFTQYVVAQDDATVTTDTLVSDSQGEPSINLSHLNFGGHMGDVSIFGLAEGTYKLVETKAPDGYITPTEPFVVVIEDEIGSDGSVGRLSVTGSHTGGATDAKIMNTLGIAESILTVWADITNQPGATLPETGGMGTALFTVLGVVLMAGAVAFFTLRKRSSAA